MAQPQTNDAAAAEMPSLPERSLRPSEENQRTSDETESKRPLRTLHASTSRAVVPSNSVQERQSYERPYQPSPSTHQQLAQWQSVNNIPVTTAGPEVTPIQGGMYGRSTSNDYTAYGGIEPTRALDHYTINPYQNNDVYYDRPYRRTGVPAHNDMAPGMMGRHTSVASGQPHIRYAAPRQYRGDGYEHTLDGYEEERTPQKKRPQRRHANLYIVRGGGDMDGSGSPPPDEVLRLPFTGFMDGTIKGHFIAVLGEFIGTTLFLFFAFAGTIVANVGAQESSANTTTNATVGFSPIVNLYVAVSFGFSLMVNVWIFFRVSGGLFNPAVTLGMVLTKAIGWVRAFLLVGAQIGGAIFASFLVQVLFPTDFNVRTTLSDSTSIVQGVFIEAILTAELVFTVFMLAKEKHKATYMAPVGIGLALFVAELVGVFFTGGSLNPARSLGPCVTTGQFDSDHWVYWVGPAIGAIAAFVFYRFIKILEYEIANPGQDNTAEEEEEKDLTSKREDV